MNLQPAKIGHVPQWPNIYNRKAHILCFTGNPHLTACLLRPDSPAAADRRIDNRDRFGLQSWPTATRGSISATCTSNLLVGPRCNGNPRPSKLVLVAMECCQEAKLLFRVMRIANSLQTCALVAGRRENVTGQEASPRAPLTSGNSIKSVSSCLHGNELSATSH
jgi:hypothetical protein